MIVAVPKEQSKNETCVAATPGTVKELIKDGAKVFVESGAGEASFISDKEYEKAGSTIITDKKELLSKGNVIIKVLAPTLDQIVHLQPKSVLISFCQTSRELDTVKALREQSVTGFSMHLIPRTTRPKDGCTVFPGQYCWI